MYSDFKATSNQSPKQCDQFSAVRCADFHRESEQSVQVMSRLRMMSRWSESIQVKSSKPHYFFHSGPLGQISLTTQVCVCVDVLVFHSLICVSAQCECNWVSFCVCVSVCVFMSEGANWVLNSAVQRNTRHLWSDAAHRKRTSSKIAPSNCSRQRERGKKASKQKEEI